MGLQRFTGLMIVYQKFNFFVNLFDCSGLSELQNGSSETKFDSLVGLTGYVES